MNYEERSRSSASKLRPNMPKIYAISSVSSFIPLNSTFHSQNTQTNRQRIETPPRLTNHKRVFSSTSYTNEMKTSAFKFKTENNFYQKPTKTDKKNTSRPMTSLFSSFHVDKTQQEFLKNQKDPLFKDFTTLINKSRPNTANPFQEILEDYRNKKEKKERELIFYLRKMNYAKALMKDLVSEFKKYESCKRNEEKEIYLNHIKENWGENSIAILKNISNLLKNLILNAGDRDSINKIFVSLIQESQNFKVYQLNLLCLVFYAKCCILTKDFSKAIATFKQAKFIAKTYSNNKIKLKCYKGLGVCCQILKNYSTAKHYFIRVLQLSWLLKDKQNELLAYDSIGLQYYYLGDLEHAEYFHFKMMKGEYEAENSALRRLGLSKLSISNFNVEKKIKTKQQIKKENSQNDMPENPIFNISSSDEEFEPMIPKDQREWKSVRSSNSITQDFRLNPNNSNFMKDSLVKQANNNIRYLSMKKLEEKKIKSYNQVKTQKHMVSAKFLQFNPNLNAKVMLSHLTPNKSVNFFHNTLFSHENKNQENQVFNKLDGRSMNKLIKKTKYFDSNIQFTIKNIETIFRCLGLKTEKQY